MTLFNLLPGFERLIPLALFALYLLTAVRICRYSSWVEAGAPNPFLPRSLKPVVARCQFSRSMAYEVHARRA